MSGFIEHLESIALSGWLTASIFGVIFSIVFYKLNERKDIKAAKSVLREELLSNLKFMSYIYWEKYKKSSDQSARDIQYPCIELIGTYSPTIIKHHPELASKLLWLFSAFQELNRTKEIISTLEDEYDYFAQAEILNEKLQLGIKSDIIMNIMNRDFSIR
jgi:hypothetical protein